MPAMANMKRTHNRTTRPTVRAHERASRSADASFQNPHSQSAAAYDASRYSRSRYGSAYGADIHADSRAGSAGAASSVGATSRSGASSNGNRSFAAGGGTYADYADRSRYTRGGSKGSSAGAADRLSAEDRASRYRYDEKKGKRRKGLTIALAVILTVVLGGAGAAFAYIAKINSNLQDGMSQGLLDSLVGTYSDSDPFYMVLMGTDASADREADAAYEGDAFRTDSLMLVRIDPKEKKATMISILRDTYVDMGEYGQNKINSAYSLGGPELTVQTVSDLAGVDINHYAEINFDGFRAIVDALGGIEVDVPMDINDPDAGGSLSAGLQTLNGDQALILCRSRHAYDEYGKGDEYRAANQRLVLSAVAKKLLQADPATIASSVSAMSQYVTTDFSVNDLIGLAQTMRGLDPETDIYTGTNPTESVYVNGGWYEIVDVEAWTAMMERVDQGLPPNEEDIIDPATGTVMATGNGASSNSVTVLNGNGTAGASSNASRLLTDAGFEAITDNADSFDYEETLIIYADKSHKQKAQELADALGVGVVQADDGSIPFDTAFLVVLGADFR